MATCETTTRGRRQRVSARGLVVLLRDRLDAARAKRCRRDLGGQLWLVSWSAVDDRTWLARVSAPDHSETVEATGPSRARAIRTAANDLARRLSRI